MPTNIASNQTSNDILSQVALLNKSLEQAKQQVADVQARKRFLESQREVLTQKLSELTGDVDWSQMNDVVAAAAERAQRSLQALTEALAEIGIEA